MPPSRRLAAPHLRGESLAGALSIRTGERLRRVALPVVAASVALLMLLPGGIVALGAGGGAPVAPAGAHLPAPTSSAPHLGPTAAAGPAYYQSDPSKGRIDAPALWTVTTFLPNRSAPSVASPPAPTVRERPDVPAGGSPAYGYLQGTILDSFTDSGVSQANVTAFSPASGSSGTTVSTTTDTQGLFRMLVPAGWEQVSVVASLYLPNQTWAKVVNSSTTYVTMELVHYGFATGQLVGADSQHEPVAGATFAASSRNGTFNFYPSGATGPTGDFRVAIPPIPIQLTINPPKDYLSNWTFLEASAWQTIDLGVLEVVPFTTVHVQVWDRVLAQKVTTGEPVEVQVCTRLTGVCAPSGPMKMGGTNVSAWAPPGADTVTVLAPGYVVNATSFASVPLRAPGSTPVDLGRVYLEPAGVAQVASNLTNQDPNIYWYAGQVKATACSLDGIELGASGGATTKNLSMTSCTSTEFAYNVGGSPAVRFAIPPLRDSITYAPVWYGMGTYPAFGTTAWVNATPDQIVYPMGTDLIAGTYVTADVNAPPGFAFPPDTHLIVCSTEEASVCGMPIGPGGANIQGCSTSADSFCATSPVGPAVATLHIPGVNPDNFTWGDVPPCCGVSLFHFPTFNLPPLANQTIQVALGNVTGRVLDHLTGDPVAGAQVSACGVGVVDVGCRYAFADGHGNFSFVAPAGWDQVTASVAGFRANWSWTNVSTLGNTSAGLIEIAPDAFLTGVVLGENGQGIEGAAISVCPVVTALCQVASSTDINGAYTLQASPGYFPWASLGVLATHAGYLPDEVWLNASEGTFTPLPPLVLLAANGNSSGSNGSGPPNGTHHASTGLTWVDGTVHDKVSGAPVADANVEACVQPVLSPSCILFPLVTSTGGAFNASLPSRNFTLFFVATGYVTSSAAPRLDRGGAVHLGVVSLSPYAWLRGVVKIDPWSAEARVLAGLGPAGAAVTACAASGPACGGGASLWSDGEFNVSAPPGIDFFNVTALGSGAGTAPGGFVPLSHLLNVTAPAGSTTTLPAPLELPIFAGLSGRVVESGVDHDPYAGNPVAWGNVLLGNNTTAFVNVVMNDNGEFVAFLPPSAAHSVNETAAGSAFGATKNGSVPALPAGGYANAPTLSLDHHGWFDLRFFDNATHAPLPSVSVTVTVQVGPAGAVQMLANSGGEANVSAPIGRAVAIHYSVTGYTPGFWLQSLAAWQWSPLGFNMTNGGGGGNHSGGGSGPNGWVRSDQVNGVNAPPTWGTIDGVTHRPIGDVLIGVTNLATGQSSPQPAHSNDLGQFLVSAPPGNGELIAMSRLGYVTASGFVNVPAGGDSNQSSIPLTAEGVIGGTVTTDPGAVPVAGATVLACPVGQFLCGSPVYTNRTGGFWVIAPPGPTRLFVDAPGFVGNNTTTVDVCSDCYVGLGPVSVGAYAQVSGVVVGLPGPVVLPGANVTLCPTPGEASALACLYLPLTDSAGRFASFVPPGSYTLYANATDYNGTTLDLTLPPGARVDLGSIALDRDGTLTGSVLAAETGAPVVGANVSACPLWNGSGCSPVAMTDARGTYAVDLPAGPAVVEASAPGYLPAQVEVESVGGSTTAVPTLFLAPLGVYPVDGTVVGGLPGSPRVAGASVTARIGPTVVGVTRTGIDGSFALRLATGTYLLQVIAPGYLVLNVPLSLAGSGRTLALTLSPFTYPLSGDVVDGLTGSPIPGAVVSVPGETSVATGAAGAFALALPNGTATLQVAGPPEPGWAYAAYSTTVRVAGGALLHNVSLSPVVVSVSASVTDAGTGLGIPGAWAEVVGHAADSAPWSANASLGPTGTPAALAIPVGHYEVEFGAPGYDPVYLSIVLSNGTAQHWLVPLDPEGSSPPSTPASPSVPAAGLAAIAGGVALAVAGILVYRYRRGGRAEDETEYWMEDGESAPTDPFTVGDPDRDDSRTDDGEAAAPTAPVPAEPSESDE